MRNTKKRPTKPKLISGHAWAKHLKLTAAGPRRRIRPVPVRGPWGDMQ